MQKILVLHGPNINMLGSREPEIYGTKSLRQIDENLKSLANSQDIELYAKQSNSESELVTYIQKARHFKTDFIIINAAAYTHTSIAIRDALLAVAIPFIEIHLSNIYARESFRHQSYLSDIAVGQISGLGPMSYELALAAAISRLTNPIPNE